jgi:hypothetical protein
VVAADAGATVAGNAAVAAADLSRAACAVAGSLCCLVR